MWLFIPSDCALLEALADLLMIWSSCEEAKLLAAIESRALSPWVDSDFVSTEWFCATGCSSLLQTKMRGTSWLPAHGPHNTPTHCIPWDPGCCGWGPFGLGSWRVTSSWRCCRSTGHCCWRCRHSQRWSHPATGTEARRSNVVLRLTVKYRFRCRDRGRNTKMLG